MSKLSPEGEAIYLRTYASNGESWSQTCDRISGTIETNDLGCHIDENLREVARWDTVPTIEIADGLPVVVASTPDTDPPEVEECSWGDFVDDDPTEVRTYQEVYDSMHRLSRIDLSSFFAGRKIPGLECK